MIMLVLTFWCSWWVLGLLLILSLSRWVPSSLLEGEPGPSLFSFLPRSGVSYKPVVPPRSPDRRAFVPAPSLLWARGLGQLSVHLDPGPRGPWASRCLSASPVPNLGRCESCLSIQLLHFAFLSLWITSHSYVFSRGMSHVHSAESIYSWKNWRTDTTPSLCSPPNTLCACGLN